MALDMNNLLTGQVRNKVESMLSTGDAEDIARAVSAVAYMKGWNGSMEDNPVVEMQKRKVVVRLAEEISAEVQAGTIDMLCDPAVAVTGTTARESDMDLYGVEIDDELLDATDLPEDPRDYDIFDDVDAEEYDESKGIV